MRYRLYIDETGTDDLTHAHMPEHRYLCLAGVIIHLDHVENFATPKMQALKHNYFPQRSSDPDSPPPQVILHRSDIINKRGPFGVLNDPSLLTAFDNELLAYLNDVEYSVISVVLDKAAMLKQTHWREKNPYHYCMEVMIEKYAQWLQRKGVTGDVMAEKRQGKKDTALISAFERVYCEGTRYVRPDLIKNRLVAKTLKLRSKEENVTGLQIADLLAHPTCKYIHMKRAGEDVSKLPPYAANILRILLATKFDKAQNGQLWGYGIKYLP